MGSRTGCISRRRFVRRLGNPWTHNPHAWRLGTHYIRRCPHMDPHRHTTHQHPFHCAQLHSPAALLAIISAAPCVCTDAVVVLSHWMPCSIGAACALPAVARVDVQAQPQRRSRTNILQPSTRTGSMHEAEEQCAEDPHASSALVYCCSLLSASPRRPSHRAETPRCRALAPGGQGQGRHRRVLLQSFRRPGAFLVKARSGIVS